MREIKFRGKSIETNEWVYGDFCTIPEPNILFLNANNEVDCEPVDPKSVGQFTGLNDNNDKDIYEGDVCTVWMGCKQDNPYVVEDLRELYLDMSHADHYYRITRIEVIGNIYENPELL
jgi:hypothetical protein